MLLNTTARYGDWYQRIRSYPLLRTIRDEFCTAMAGVVNPDFCPFWKYVIYMYGLSFFDFSEHFRGGESHKPN